jgi:carotenoid cleavage dioxygenase-like enzyme
MSAAKKGKMAGKPNPILQGNFAPLDKENSYEVGQIISGQVPKDINGVYIRNGPNPKLMPENKCHHWFDGDAMLHVMRLKDG